METIPQIGTKVKVIGRQYEYFSKVVENFDEKNEFEVLGQWKPAKSKVTLIRIKNLHHIFGGTPMTYFKDELEQIE